MTDIDFENKHPRGIAGQFAACGEPPSGLSTARDSSGKDFS